LTTELQHGINPAEAEAMLGAFKELAVKKFIVFLKTKKVNEEEEFKSHEIDTYFNRRSYKYSMD